MINVEAHATHCRVPRIITITNITLRALQKENATTRKMPIIDTSDRSRSVYIDNLDPKLQLSDVVQDIV